MINKVNSITDRGTIVIKLEGKCYSKEAAKLCVQYLYKGVAKLTDSNVKAVARIAQALELKEILKICSSFQDTFKLVKEETSEEDYGSDTEVEQSDAEDVDQISKNLTVALEEALDNIQQMEEQSENRVAAEASVDMEIPSEVVKGEPKPEHELESAIESIRESENVPGNDNVSIYS